MEYGSEKYLDIFLKTDKIISSISEEWVDKPFGNNYKYLKDLFPIYLCFEWNHKR